jgi:hypothetical protein
MLLILVIGCAAAQVSADGSKGQSEVWLVTYGPGEVYWQRFGHNAIWIRAPELGLDHTINFGFFDFEQEDFFLRFLQGRMLYFSAAQPARDEFASYIDENRGIRAQKLDLTGSQKQELIEYLLSEVRPENRDYLYDYYLNNCSTRVRDARDRALGGALRSEFESAPASQTWRDHTRRLTQADFWLYLGLEVGLGVPVDGSISAWDEMFIPEKLAEALSGFHNDRAGSSSPLVLEDVLLHRSTLTPPPASPRAWWPRYLLASLAVLAGVWIACRLGGPGWARAVARTWLVVSGLVGCALLFFWFGTDHSVARNNLNLQIFNPLWLLLGLWRGHEKLTLIIVGVLSLITVTMPLLPPWQYNLDVIAAFVPLNLAAAWTLYACRPRSVDRPGAGS